MSQTLILTLTHAAWLGGGLLLGLGVLAVRQRIAARKDAEEWDPY